MLTHDMMNVIGNVINGFLNGQEGQDCAFVLLVSDTKDTDPEGYKCLSISNIESVEGEVSLVQSYINYRETEKQNAEVSNPSGV